MSNHSDETEEPEVRPNSESNPVVLDDTKQTELTVPADRLVDLEPDSEVR